MFKMSPAEYVKTFNSKALRHDVARKAKEEILSGKISNNCVTLVLETVAGAYWGCKKHIPLSECFRYELKKWDKISKKRAVTIRKEIDKYARECAEILTKEMDVAGHFYFGDHPVYQDYCLFYRESV